MEGSDFSGQLFARHARENGSWNIETQRWTRRKGPLWLLTRAYSIYNGSITFIDCLFAIHVSVTQVSQSSFVNFASLDGTRLMLGQRENWDVLWNGSSFLFVLYPSFFSHHKYVPFSNLLKVSARVNVSKRERSQRWAQKQWFENLIKLFLEGFPESLVLYCACPAVFFHYKCVPSPRYWNNCVNDVRTKRCLNIY